MVLPAAVTWQGNVADGHLTVGDWSSWRWGRLDQRGIPDLAAYFTAIETGCCVGSSAPAAALVLALSKTLFTLAIDWDLSVPGDDLDSSFLELIDNCAPLLEDPLIHWAIGRLRDCSDAHLYILGARELSARLFMEARRIQRELAQREERLIEELLRQRDERRLALLASDNACYGPSSCLITSLLASDPTIAIEPGPYGELLRGVGLPAERLGRRPGDGVLAVAAYAVDERGVAFLDPACADSVEAHIQAGGVCWLLLSRFARGRPGHLGRDRCGIAVERFERLLTESWTSDQPAFGAGTLGVAEGEQSSFM
jgi:hypothetical protein